jgi:hypothetical protein
MEEPRKFSVMPWLALACAIASLAFGFLPVHSARDGPPPMPTEVKYWVSLTLLSLPISAFIYWRYRTTPARWAFWILFLLAVLMVWSTTLRYSRYGYLS